MGQNIADDFVPSLRAGKQRVYNCVGRPSGAVKLVQGTVRDSFSDSVESPLRFFVKSWLGYMSFFSFTVFTQEAKIHRRLLSYNKVAINPD